MTLKNYSSMMDVSNGQSSSASSTSSLIFPSRSTPNLSTIDEQSRSANSNDKFIPTLQAKLRKFILRSASANISHVDPVIKTIYLGNVVTTWGKGSGCLERPASALWKNHCEGRASIRMTVMVTPSGLKVETSEHGLTEYWNNRLTWCGIPNDSPKLFCWIYRHEGRKLKQELRCHAVLCNSKDDAKTLMESLRMRLSEALYDFRKEKLQKQNARLSSYYHVLYNTSPSSLYQGQPALNGNANTTTSQNNYKKERPCPSKLSIIEESEEEESFLLPELTSYDKVIHHLLQLELRHDNARYYRVPAVSPTASNRTTTSVIVNNEPNPTMKHRSSSLDSSDGTKSSEADSSPSSVSPPSSVIDDHISQHQRVMDLAEDEDDKTMSSSASSSRSNSAGSELEIFPTTNMDAMSIINASCMKKSPSASLLHHHLKQLQLNNHKNSNSICYEQIICSV